MKLLVLGGTQFVGRHIVEAARAAQHDVTVFHRGRTNPALYEGVSGVAAVQGDRRTLADLEAVVGRQSFDAVIDTCGYIPADMPAPLATLAGVGRYAFISSISVYPDLGGSAVGEDDPVAPLPEGASTTEVDGANYGPLKAMLEQSVRTTFGERALIVRPGLIAGPYDPTDRFTYWVRRMAEGGEMLAPGDGRRLVQVIAAADVARFLVQAVAEGVTGTFNLTGDATPMATVLDAVRGAAERLGREPAVAEWIGEEALQKAGVRGWVDLPMLIFGADQRVPNARAKAAGLTLMPLEELARTTLSWDMARGAPPLKTGLPRSRERELLAGAG